MNKKYHSIVEHYENCLAKHGDNHLGVDWPKEEDASKRYQVMLDILKPQNDEKNYITLLDFGCGTGHLYEFILKNKLDNIQYFGLDISEKFIHVAREKFPEITFFCGDILDMEMNLPCFDYIVMNGVFTEKRDLSFEEMWTYFMMMIEQVYSLSKKGIAFNAMSKYVDWEREDLFHLPLDLMGSFLCEKISRDFIVRNDYGLYEYTVYILNKKVWPK